MSRREEIIYKAINIAVERGFQQVTIKSLAEACGITEPAIYRHFKNKDDIIIAVIDKLHSGVLQIIRKGLKEATISSLKKTINEVLDLLGNLKGVGVLLLSESTYTNNKIIKKRLYEFYNALVESFEEFYKQLKDKGLISGKADCKALAILTVAIFQSVSVRLILSDGKIPITQKVSEMISILLKGAFYEV